MMPVNGVAGKPAKTTTRRAASKVVVPVLPLNYPQRPANRQISAAAPTPIANGQTALQPGAEKPMSHPAEHPQELAGKTPTAPGPSSANNINTGPPSAAPPQAICKAELSGPGTASDDRAKEDTPTASSAFPYRRMASPARHRPPGLPFPAPEVQSTSGLAPEGRTPAAHPAIMNRPAFHQPHPSNGSLVFGLRDSNASSPAPRPGGGFPPPGLLQYPPVPAVDGYGRPLLVSPALDGYLPNRINHHGPPTPHSFHGSQSSVQAEEHGFNHYPAINGHNGYHADPTAQGPMPLPAINPPVNGTAHAAIGSISGVSTLRDQDEALSFLRHGVSDDTFNDCFLEVRFPDSAEFQDHPGYRQLQRMLRTHGHRFVFSRSPRLASVMKAQGTMPGGVIFVEIHDEYMRPDVFWYSLRTLYGWSLADGILPTELRLRDVRDDLKTALSYLATARYLRLPWVHSVALHRASRLLYWNTIELAVKFVSQAVAIPPRNDGLGASELLDHVLAFIVHNFPADFVLDVNVGDSSFPRLPPSSSPSRNPNAPTIAHGTSSGHHSRQSSMTQAQMPRNPRVSSNLWLSQIKFGDISPPKNGHGPGPGGSPEPAQSARTPTPNDTILSQILLDLPFELLKQILEHPHLAKLSGDFGPSARQAIISDTIAERESRRLRALEKTDPQSRVYQERVDNASAPLVVGQMDDFWVNNLGFKEEVFSGDLPYLVHTWSQGSASSVGA
ncbi:hypothetical protein BT67DRAFT_42261 [Trichocladium antarcticum]|uniref:Uncharacterized protein n=1 Tax=Trichocladium antarcticum TaxID=1450529 RepID=A0AAN6UJ93_9PEZI|nr:hypothetical protein BT67DRAFT_42261 [Trichocladium antarcticum]